MPIPVPPASSDPPNPVGTGANASIAARFKAAVALHQQGQLSQAEALYRDVLAETSTHADALHLLGVIHQQRGQHETAVSLIEQSITITADRPAPYSNLGIALHRLKRFDEALARFDQALQLRPDYAEALVNRGNTLRDLGRHQQALDSYQRALAIKADSPEALLNCGNALQDLKRPDEALACYDRVLQLRPNYLDAHVYRGNALQNAHRHGQALASYDRALQLNPDHVAALISRGNALQSLKRHEQALACYARVLELDPDRHEVLNNRGSALRELKRYAEAAEAFARLASLCPGFDYAESNRFHSQLYCCDWNHYEQSVQQITELVLADKRADVPFSFLAISPSAAAQLQCALRYVADRYPAAAEPLWPGPRRAHDRIHLAYLSADFHAHATAYLMARLFELHDRKRFHVTAISFGPDADDQMRRRLQPAFDAFVDVRHHSDLEVAKLMRELEIDIAIDLKGFTTGNRAGILARRAAPIQASYLGYPGTMGADYIDYLIADAQVVPLQQLQFYSEKVVHLPDSYQVNDSLRAISTRVPTRAQAGLPERGFVFCCFNNSYKITPTVFYTWMRLLKRVPGSVLWLLDDNPDASRNLRSEANRSGIAPERLVFASRIELDEHLARHQLADLFLDTLPCNAHTTASDALWAGLPVLTCVGSSFAGRVAASLLSALDLGELISSNLDEYEALALQLASTPAWLAGIRAKLEHSRMSSALFDSERFCRHLESAYLSMWQRHTLGQPPASFAVPASP